MRKQIHQAGFTLIELMVVVAILAILLGAGLPSLRAAITSNNISTEANKVAHSLTYARSQAASLGQAITMTTLAGAGSKDWSQGWQISSDILLKQTEATSAILTISSNDSKHSTITFLSSGRLSATNNGVQIAVCDGDRSSSIQGRLITVNAVGRVNVTAVANTAANCDL